MSSGTDLMHKGAQSWRRHSLLEGVVGFALLAVGVLCAMQGETWHAAAVAFVAGATLSAAFLTYAKAMLWERVASDREANRNASKEG